MLAVDALAILLALTSNLAFVTVVQATLLMRRDVIAPKIITPNADTVWTVGNIETVTWDTSNFPPDSQITNPNGQIVLGHQANGSLNLDIEHPLASGFKLRDSSVNLTVPDVPPRDDYLIVLFGDSGNTSPAFTITRITRRSLNSLPSDSSASLPIITSTSDDKQPPTSTTSTSVVLVTESSSPPTTEPPTSSSTVQTSTSSSVSSSSSLASPTAGSVPANSSGTSLLTANKSNLMALTSCIVYAVLFLLV